MTTSCFLILGPELVFTACPTRLESGLVHQFQSLNKKWYGCHPPLRAYEIFPNLFFFPPWLLLLASTVLLTARVTQQQCFSCHRVLLGPGRRLVPGSLAARQLSSVGLTHVRRLAQLATKRSSCREQIILKRRRLGAWFLQEPVFVSLSV